MSKSSEKLDLATRAAWLYYVAGDTQNEIAEKLQVSRPVAQRLVAFAVEKNLIRVRVDHRIADCLDLAAQLSKRYGLAMCEVVPIDGDAPDAIDRKLAVAGAQVMERYLNEERPMVIAVSSGRTLKAAVAQIAQLERPQHRLVSMVGAIAQDGSSNPYDVAQHISEKTGGKHFLLPAPLFADSEAERAQWCNHRLYRIVEKLSAQADVAFVGVGNIGAHCPLFEDGFITAAELGEMVELGAVAEMLGLPIDAQGRPIVASTSTRVTSVGARCAAVAPDDRLRGRAAQARRGARRAARPLALGARDRRDLRARGARRVAEANGRLGQPGRVASRAE
ncbi:putative sugar-binding domain protein [Burkholderia pseudomallei MSHR1000]|nr:sugar-binding transcriptional regulator [Burkholderia pseudomallei]KGW40191.1 putative sugar-binding domain protein [Burkholderia pseudomallei MSHR1000]